MKKGDLIILDEIATVKVTYCDETLMQVEYNDLTRRLLKISDYSIKYLSSEERNLAITARGAYCPVQRENNYQLIKQTKRCQKLRLTKKVKGWMHPLLASVMALCSSLRFVIPANTTILLFVQIAHLAIYLQTDC